jgi:ABC-type glycerol-3-phosphate transport system permease component
MSTALRYRQTHILKKAGFSVFALIVAVSYAFPLLYMVASAFKSDYTIVPPRLIFPPTLDTFKIVVANPDIWRAFGNSFYITIVSLILSVALGCLCSYVMVFARFRKPTTPGKIYYWFVTCFILPPVAVLIPLYLFFKTIGILGSQWSMIYIYVGTHSPLVIWIMHPHFAEIPKEIVESADIDGCGKILRFFKIIFPMVGNGVWTASLLLFIFLWNEFFFSFNLTAGQQSTLPVFISRFGQKPQMFWHTLCAASVISVLPTIVVGFFSQRSFAKGIIFGAVKG